MVLAAGDRRQGRFRLGIGGGRRPLYRSGSFQGFRERLSQQGGGTRAFGIISPTAFKKNGIEWARWNPIGTGPFKFVKFQRGSVLQYRKNENYWMKGRPYLDGIDYLFIRDPHDPAGGHAIERPGPEDRRAVRHLRRTGGHDEGPGVQDPRACPSAPYRSIPDSANADSPLSKQKVREAISYAIDREGIVKARGFGIWKPAYQIQPDNMATYIPNLQGTLYNPQKAQAAPRGSGLSERVQDEDHRHAGHGRQGRHGRGTAQPCRRGDPGGDGIPRQRRIHELPVRGLEERPYGPPYTGACPIST